MYITDTANKLESVNPVVSVGMSVFCRHTVTTSVLIGLLVGELILIDMFMSLTV